jgi:Bacterial archaeo-eukaryotic release factor family 2
MAEHGTSGRNEAVRAAELVEIASWDGPFLGVLLDTRGSVENPAEYAEHRWKVLREQLVGAGVGPRCLDAVDGFVPDAHLEGAALSVTATPHGLVHVEHGTEPPAADRGTWTAVPHLVTLVEWRQQTIPYVLVLVDHKGADVLAVSHVHARALAAAGVREEPVTKAAPGGWSQRRYQRRAENTWRDNARDGARVAASLADRIGAELVLVAGDDRSRHLLVAALPAHLVDRVRAVEGGRAADGSRERVDEAVARQVRGIAAQHTASLLETFHDRHGQARRAVDGARDTVAALADGRVETLLVHADAGDERIAWLGRSPRMVALDRHDLPSADAAAAVHGPLVDVAVTETLRSGGGVRVVPAHGGPAEGIGAILRWSD